MTNLKRFLKSHKIQVHVLPAIMILTIIFFSLGPCSTVHAYFAQFTVTHLDSIGNVDTSESIFQGDPDLYYIMGIFEDPSYPNLNSTWNVFGAGSTYSTTGYWNIPDTTISREIDQPQVYLYFALLDDDPIEANDLLGDHWFFSNSNNSGLIWNNNSAPFQPNYLSSGLDIEGSGWASNYRLNYNVTITPIPGALWLLGSGLVAMVGLRRRYKK